jgi:hypothetical protein
LGIWWLRESFEFNATPASEEIKVASHLVLLDDIKTKKRGKMPRDETRIQTEEGAKLQD